MIKFFLLLTFFYYTPCLHAASIQLQAKNATVWLPQQIIQGSTQGLAEKTLRVHLNDSSFIIPLHNERFSIAVLLKQKINYIWVETTHKETPVISDTIRFELGYKPLPLIHPYATAKGNTVFLHADIKQNPYNKPLSFTWRGDKRNPAAAKIINGKKGEAKCSLPLQQGDYYFNLLVVAEEDSAVFQTVVIRSDKIHCFNLRTDHAAWIDTAIVYEITPHVFTENHNYNDITEKLPELSKLGINCIWLQPVYRTQKGHQGYDITDFFSLRKDLGTEQELQQLIITAKQLHIKVLFDFVPNHTSVFHPYAQNAILYHSNSHYYDFYQRDDDGALYASLYHKDSLGFYHYFWKDLVNLNYNNKETQQWIIEACKYWLTKFDLDGYRFDAMWAVNARNDSFGIRLQTTLKSIKPDILLLAEDKGERKQVYNEGYDAAYDWRADTNWISHWSWQYDYSPQNNLTIFNFADENKRSQKLDTALFSGDVTHLRLRFMENNDLPGFINIHGLKKTKMVAAFMFALPGIPLLYNGQETGCSNKVYSPKPIFKSGESIQSQDGIGLFTYYGKLIQIRNQYKSLRSFNMQKLAVNGSGAVLALYRWKENEKFIVVMNMSENIQTVNIRLDNIDTSEKNSLFFNDVLSNEIFTAGGKNLELTLQQYSTRLLVLQ